MFNFFKSSPKLKITPADKEWVEKSFMYFGSIWGFGKTLEKPFLLPSDLVATDFKDGKNFENLVIQMCGLWELDIEQIEIMIFDDIDSQEWASWKPHSDKSTLGLYETENKKQKVYIGKSNLATPELLISVLAHELAHAFLLGNNYLHGGEPDHEYLTDLAIIFKGFGIFFANSVIYSNSKHWISKSGYLGLPVISYANALLTSITNKDSKEFFNYLNANTREMYQNDCEYLKKADDTQLSVFEIQRIDKIYQYGKEIDEAYKQNLYQEVIRIATEWIKIDSRASLAYNNRGYAKIRLQNYQSALEDFTKAISYNPFNAYAFNNRGYCKIKLGKVQEAYMDLYTSMETDDTNSYVWLNFAIYYMEVSDIEKSLLHIEQALLLDPNTDNINEYATLIYEKAGNQEKAQEYQKKC